jgi:hypothetical protein
MKKNSASVVERRTPRKAASAANFPLSPLYVPAVQDAPVLGEIEYFIIEK